MRVKSIHYLYPKPNVVASHDTVVTIETPAGIVIRAAMAFDDAVALREAWNRGYVPPPPEAVSYVPPEVVD